MQIHKKIRSGNKDVDAYIEQLENFVTGLDADNVYRMLVAIDENAGLIADDIVKIGTIADDERLEEELKLLGSKKNKRFEAFLSLVKQVKDFDVVGKLIKERRAKIGANEEPKEEAIQETAPVEAVKPKKNLQDFVIH